VAAGDAGDGGQADAGPLELFVTVQSLEGLEQFVGVGHVEPAAVVPDEQHRFLLGGVVADLDGRVRGVPGEFQGVADEVLQRDGDQLPVACTTIRSGMCTAG
jgi:hypothetical protein